MLVVLVCFSAIFFAAIPFSFVKKPPSSFGRCYDQAFWTWRDERSFTTKLTFTTQTSNAKRIPLVAGLRLFLGIDRGYFRVAVAWPSPVRTYSNPTLLRQFQTRFFEFTKYVPACVGLPHRFRNEEEERSYSLSEPTTHAIVYSCSLPLILPALLSGLAPAIVFWRGPLRRWRHRHRREGYCEKCEYDLTGNLSGVCPECGTPIKPGESTQPPHTY